MNYILSTCKLKILECKSLDDWLLSPSSSTSSSRNFNNRRKKKRKGGKGRKSSPHLDNLERKQLAIAQNAFAFQHFQYFPADDSHLLKYNKEIWDRIKQELKTMHDKRVVDPRGRTAQGVYLGEYIDEWEGDRGGDRKGGKKDVKKAIEKIEGWKDVGLGKDVREFVGGDSDDDGDVEMM